MAKTYKPLLVKYLSRTRKYRYKKLELDIAPGIFHPGFFFSTQLLLQYISKMQLQKKEFLELGCGSGLISMVAAGKGAKVTATDINPLAVEWLQTNCHRNKLEATVFQSDLFCNMANKKFDIIAINPPYYKKEPLTIQDHAWFCGRHGAYFNKLFKTMGDHIHAGTEILMVVFDGCDMDMINGFAAENQFVLKAVSAKRNLLEKNFIYKIEKQ